MVELVTNQPLTGGWIASSAGVPQQMMRFTADPLFVERLQKWCSPLFLSASFLSKKPQMCPK